MKTKYKQIDSTHKYRNRKMLQSMAEYLGYEYITEMYVETFKAKKTLGATARFLGMTEPAVKIALKLCDVSWCKDGGGGNNRKVSREMVSDFKQQYKKHNGERKSFIYGFIDDNNLSINFYDIFYSIAVGRTWVDV